LFSQTNIIPSDKDMQLPVYPTAAVESTRGAFGE